MTAERYSFRGSNGSRPSEYVPQLLGFYAFPKDGGTPDYSSSSFESDVFKSSSSSSSIRLSSSSNWFTTSSSTEIGGIGYWTIGSDFVVAGSEMPNLLNDSSSLSSQSSSSLSSSSLSSQSYQPLPEDQTRRAVIVTLENDDVLVNREHRCFDLISEKLVDNFGFVISSRLKDADATIANVEAAIVSATINMSPGDAFVFAFGGHGSRIFDSYPQDELDDYDEGRVLYDGFWRDDRIRALIDAMPAGIKITFMLDSCYAGNGTRAVKRQKKQSNRRRKHERIVVCII